MRGTRAAFLAALAVGTLAVGGCGDSGAAPTTGVPGMSSGTSADPDGQLDGVTANLEQVEREVDGDGAG